MKIVIVGLPYFAKKISKNLHETDVAHSYIAIELGAGIFQKAKYFWQIISADIIYQIGGSHACGGTLRLATALNKKIIMHWVGTDVLNLANAFSRQEIDVELIKKTIHLCEVNWIQRELSDLGVYANIAQIACFEDAIPTPARFPDSFSILTYVGKGREVFYGLGKLITLAQIFPEIEIRVAGISEYSEPLPPNMRLLGWVDNMRTEYENCILYLRLPEHDGLAFSVLEALACGRYVGYVNKFSWTQKIDNDAALVDFVKSLVMKFDRNLLNINSDGYDFIARNYSRSKVMNNLIKIITG